MKVAEERMASKKKLLERIMSGSSDASIPFDSMRNLLKAMGFEERQRRGGSSHYVYKLEGIPGLIVIQEEKGNVKTYQVRQIRNLIEKHGLAEKGDDSDG
jgi:predicted RNA binding protein YcfA (HicA-like mRNA interferase family)